MQYRAATTDIRDRKQRAEELQGRVKSAGKAAKHVGEGGKTDKNPRGGGGKGGGEKRLRAGGRGPNARKAAPKPSGGPAKGGGGMGPSRPSAPRGHAPSNGMGDGPGYDPGYEPPPRKDRLRRRQRDEDDE